MTDPDYATERRLMVARQIEGRGIQDPRVLDAMLELPRHRFVPDDLRHRAYDDCALAIGENQTISQPYMVALMTELLALDPGDKVLEIGTGSGYQTAVLARLAHDIISIERHIDLAERAATILKAFHVNNVEIKVGDGSMGYPDRAPFDAILVTAGAPSLPKSLGSQLGIGGRLVCPVGPRDMQELIRLVRTPDGLEEERSIRCTFVPLVGVEGWEDSQP